MAGDWLPLPIETKLFTNVPEEGLTRAFAALENCFITEAGGHVRFPGLSLFTNLGGKARVSLWDWRGDLIAVTGEGRVYRVKPNGTAQDVTGVPVAGGNRVIFSGTEDELLMAAGGPIIRFAGEHTELLSPDAPDATHVQFIDNYLVANEVGSGRFRHTDASAYSTWQALNTFSASGNPDNIDALIVTDFGELLAMGPKTIEQFERLATGSIPFFRRWRVGEGLHPGARYTVILADNATWCVNKLSEFVRFSGQSSQPHSDDLGATFETIDNWTDAWADYVAVSGQKFIILQFPHASNVYGTKGLTFLLDIRQKKWSALFGWDEAEGQPTRWPGWSIHELKSPTGRGKRYVGGEGCIYELTTDTFHHNGTIARVLARTAHFKELGEARIDGLRLTIKRGVGTYETEPVLRIRAIKDIKYPTMWEEVGLGKSGSGDMIAEFGEWGCASTWQFEWMVTDDCPIELMKLEVRATKLG
jgi:hypothetical protein